MSRRARPGPLPQPSSGLARSTRASARETVRGAAAWVIDRTLASRAPVDAHLAAALERFDERDQSLLRELTLGTLRWLSRLDSVIERASARQLADIDPILRPILRIGAYQLLFLDRVPAHAAVGEAVQQASRASHRGGASFVNAVLRRIAREPELEAWPVEIADPVARLADEGSHPEAMVRRWLARFGEERTRAILAADNRPKGLHLLAFRDRGGRELLAESLIDEEIGVEPSNIAPCGVRVKSGNPFPTAAFRRGDFYVQDEASQAAALVPAPAPGERILDVAAAPGGKSFSLLAAEPGVRILAADASLDRLATLRQNVRRLRRALPALAVDAARPAWRDAFDRVVADLPCTGTGTLRKHPELKWRWSEKELARLTAQGRTLLEGAAHAVRRGGLLVAITCSLEAEENEDTGRAFLAARTDFAPFDLDERLDATLRPAIAGPGLWRLFPEDDHDGFTVQVFRRA